MTPQFLEDTHQKKFNRVIKRKINKKSADLKCEVKGGFVQDNYHIKCHGRPVDQLC